MRTAIWQQSSAVRPDAPGRSARPEPIALVGQYVITMVPDPEPTLGASPLNRLAEIGEGHRSSA
jgi:hypothetical protein